MRKTLKLTFLLCKRRGWSRSSRESRQSATLRERLLPRQGKNTTDVVKARPAGGKHDERGRWSLGRQYSLRTKGECMPAAAAAPSSDKSCDRADTDEGQQMIGRHRPTRAVYGAFDDSSYNWKAQIPRRELRDEPRLTKPDCARSRDSIRVEWSMRI